MHQLYCIVQSYSVCIGYQAGCLTWGIWTWFLSWYPCLSFTFVHCTCSKIQRVCISKNISMSCWYARYMVYINAQSIMCNDRKLTVGTRVRILDPGANTSVLFCKACCCTMQLALLLYRPGVQTWKTQKFVRLYLLGEYLFAKLIYLLHNT